MSGIDFATRMSLIDSVTPVLRNITTGMDSVINNMEMMSRSSKGMVDTASLQAGRKAVEQLKGTVDQIEKETEENRRKQEEHNNSIRNGTGSADGLLGKIKGIAAAYISFQAVTQGTKMAVGMSDEMALTKARLTELTGDMGKAKILQDQIYNSAQRSRGEYAQTADIVSKLGMQAGHNFGGMEEIVAFTEQLQKRFKIAGTDAQGVESVMYNLTQAMSSGVLRGQDLNSVLANAPSIAQDTAKYMGYTVDQVKQLAEDGKLTADVVKEAMLASADEINAKFENIPMTFGDAWTMGVNMIQKSLEPVMGKLNEIVNTDSFQEALNGIVTGISWLANLLVEVLGLAIEFGVFISENWGIIAPIVMGIVTALTIYAGVAMTLAVINGIVAVSEGVKAAAQTLATGATFAQTAAQHGLNAALLACPITWIILLIIGLIAVLYAGVAAFNKLSGSSVSATGIIVGAFAYVATSVMNFLKTIFNNFKDVLQGIWNGFLSLGEFIANVFHDPVGAAAKLIANLGNIVLDIIGNAVKLVDSFLGTDFSSGIESLQAGINKWADGMISEKYVSFDKYKLNMSDLELKDATKAAQSGYDVGKELGDKISGAFDPNKLLGDLGKYGQELGDIGGTGIGSNMNDVAGNTGKIAKDTSKMSEQLERTNDDLKYLLSLAENRSINRFSIDKIDIRMENQFGDVTGNGDMDGFSNDIVGSLKESIEAGIGGVILV